MDRTEVSEARARAVVDCSAYALCSDVLVLGWTAVTPCRGCVTGAAIGSARAATADQTTAGPAPIVTGDELERLLCQAHQRMISARTS